ncbi:MAG TPA: endopeptidase [Thermoanaerobaculia bacterium]|nr:endopeptidase [Thermoanaerobaculia bacterium]
MQPSERWWRRRAGALAALVGLAVAGAGLAIEPKQPASFLDHKEFFEPELAISSSHAPAEQVLDRLGNRPEWAAFLAGGQGRRGFVDPRSGAATAVVESRPLIPGRGVGNRVDLAELSQRVGRPVAAVDRSAVADAVLAAVRERKALLGIDAEQLGPARAEQVTADLWQVSVPQVYKGVPVRHGRVAATISHGNLVIVGTETWGDVRGLSTRPRVTAGEALAAGYAYLDGASALDVMVQEPTLEIFPVAPPEHQRGEAFGGPIGAGYRHRLVWTWAFRRPPDDATWEVVVDAHDGEVLSFQDVNRYVNHTITGGVYPITATGICPTPGTCGTMQSGWPMPFANTGLLSPNNFTNSAGVFDWTSGTTTTTLNGQFVRILDSCGTITNSSTVGSIGLGGSNNQHDCTTGGGSAGNTAAARTAFYEVNKLAEQARGWLPGNAWLNARLTANVNLNNTCNAFWNGSTINFYRSGGGCRNTGELAGVFDHEWGHGLDDNDAGGGLSNSSEAYADIAAIYRLQDSCIGHGFFETTNQGCGMTADGTGFNADEAIVGAAHCNTNCSGVRDADWARHADNTPDTALGFVCNSCSSGTGPCGRQVHCAAAPVRQAAWDLVARDLQAAPFNYDSQTAFIVGNKLFYQGSGNVGAWHACTCGSSSSGCGATNGYMQWLAADDDNGNLGDGTPHMTAIHAAFNRHGIACSTPTPQNGGCSAGPSAAPSLAATAGDFQAGLSWGSVSGATRYWVFRTEGHAGCNFGKTLIGETTGTSFTDTEVANGRQYHYNVVAAGSNSACFGRASNCASVTPTPGAPTPDFSVACSPSSVSVTQGLTATTTCTVTSTGGFSAAVALSCAGLPSGVTCGFSPSSVTPPANGTAQSTLTVTAGVSATTGSATIQVRGTSGATQRSTNLGVTVNPAGGGGGGPQNAVFDAGLQAPRCSTVGSSCDSGTLLVGRGTMSGGAEPNQPNTIGDSCADGSSGVFHSDESNDRIVVSTLDGTDFASGKTVRIDATVFVWTGGPTQDHLDLYFAADATSPTWQFIGTINPTSSQGGVQTFSATYTLPAGSLQAVRARMRYQGSATACGTGSFIDHDDLVFAVDGGGGGGPTTVFFDDFETAQGWTTDPSGTDTATSGLWERGNPETTTSSGTKQQGTTPSGVNDLVTGRLAGSSAGVDDIDNGVTSIRSPAIALPSTGTLTLSFAYYLAHGTNSSSADFLRVSVVGAVTTTVLQELGAANDDDAVFATHSANISSFAGQTVRILIEAADVSTASLVEAAVDDVRITQQ